MNWFHGIFSEVLRRNKETFGQSKNNILCGYLIVFDYVSWIHGTFYQKWMTYIKFPHCGNCGNFLKHLFSKHFVKVTKEITK